MTRIFISYSNQDGKDFAAQLRALFIDKFGEGAIWQDVIAMEGGKNWWFQITEALDNVDYMVLVASPGAMDSKVVGREWRYARQQGVCVYPVLIPDNPPDFSQMPRWMRDSHFYRYESPAQQEKLINDLNSVCDVPRVPFMADDLEGFVNRPKEFDALKQKLLDAERSEPIAITAALKGAGGFGKTTLARALCWDDDIQEAFDDGILWITLGEKVDSVLEHLLDLIVILGGERAQFSTLGAAKTRFKELMAERDILLVIDDVWNSTDLKPFLEGGERCARLITTRNDAVLPDTAQKVDVDAMQPAEGTALLQQGLPASQSQALSQLAQRLGNWALLLKLVNGALRKRIEHGNNLPTALAYVKRVLDKRGLAGFQSGNQDERHAAVASCLQISFDQLEPHELERFHALAIFPDDTDIPLTTVAQLWAVDDLDTEETCERLADLSLLLDLDLQNDTLRLHDVIREYLQGQVNLPATHQQLLEAWGYKDSPLPPVGEGLGVREHPPVGEGLGVRALPDPYAWHNIAYHLSGADRADDLRQLLLNIDWLQAKLNATDLLQLLADFDYAPQDEALRLLRSAIVMSLDTLLIDKDSLAYQLTGRLDVHRSVEGVHQFLVDARSNSNLLVSLNTTQGPVGDYLLRVLHGHTSSVHGALQLQDGRILSWSGDKTLRLWSPDGEALAKLEGHTSSVHGALQLQDGRILSWSGDHTLRLWSSDGAALATLEGHKWEVLGALQLEGGDAHGRILSWAGDRTLRLWSLEGEALASLEGHSYPVLGALQLEGGDAHGRILSWSFDGTLRLWSADGEALATLEGHTNEVRGALQLADGRILSWAYEETTLRLWSAEGVALATLEGHTDAVLGALQLAHGRILSWSGDRTLRLWSSDGEALATLEGHTRGVRGALQLEGDNAHGRILSWSFDGTLRLWSAEGEGLATLEGHTNWVRGALQLADGRLLSWDDAYDEPGTLRLWSPEGDPLSTLYYDAVLSSLVILSDGRTIVFGDENGRVNFFRVPRV